MKPALLLLAALVVGLSVASSQHGHHERHHHKSGGHGRSSSSPRPADFAPQYRQQKEYIYQYDAQIATGLTGQQQNAVQRMRAQLRLTFTSDRSAVGQLKQWQASRLNDDAHQAVSQMMRMESLRPIEIPKRHLDMLEKPFEISYDQGKIAEIVFDKQDQPWSENIKRAALNSLQLQMKDVSDERDSMSYRRNETTIEGKCESVYTIIPQIKCNTVKSTEGRYLEPKDKGECVQVTKSINFDMCKERPTLRYNNYRGEQLDTTRMSDHKEQRALAQSTLTQIELKKDEGKYLVRFARTISHQTLHLTDKTAMMAIQIAELQLKAIKKPTQNAAEVEQRKQPATLMHSLEFDEMRERFVESSGEEYLKQQPYLTEGQIAEVIVTITKRMAKSFVVDSQNEWSIDSDSIAHQFINLVKILRHATRKDLETAEDRLFRNDNEIPSAQQKSTMKRIYTDALALAATQPTVQQLLAKIQTKEVREEEAANALQKLARNAPMVGEEMLRAVWEQCEKSPKTSSLQHACVLAWSRMANIRCGRNTGEESAKKIGDEWAMDKKSAKGDEEQTERCSSSFKQELAKNVQSLYEQAADDSEQRILALKAYGNMGLDITVHKIEELINDRKAPRMERIVAIDALRNLVTVVPHKIRRTLMNVFINKAEHPEVRQNAVHIILKTQPDKATIDQIASETLREANVNVRSFVISELRNTAKTMEKINPKCAQQMRATVQLFKLSSPEQVDQTRRSSSRFASIALGEQLVNVASLFSNDSRLPKELMLQLDAAFKEHFIPAYFQVGVHQQNVEQIVERLFEKIGSRSMDEILVRGKRSLFTDPIQTMKGMFEQLRIVARRSSNDQSQLMFYKREKQFDTWFVLVDQTHMPEPLKQLVTGGELDMSALLETQGTTQLKSVDANFMFESRVKVPTIFGVPVVRTICLAKVSALYGSITSELDGQGKYISSGRVSIKTVPKVSMKMLQKLEAFSPLFTAGVQLQQNLDAQVPLGIEATVSERDGLIVDMKLPERKDQTYKLIQYAAHPSTLYREWPLKSRVYIEHEERTLFLPRLQSAFVTVDKRHHCPLTGLEMELRGHYHPGLEGSYLGENALELHAHVNEKTAKVVRFQVHAGSKQAQGQSLETQRLMKIFEAKHKQLFKDNTKPEEMQMLKEYIQRQSSQAASRYEIDAKVMALAAPQDKSPKAQIEALMKTSCDSDMKMCAIDARLQSKSEYVKDEDWSVHVVGNIARPTITGLHGSIRSQHVLAHAEMQFGAMSSLSSEKNTVVLCAYGRPSDMAIAHWNELKNMRSAARSTQSDRFASMEDEDYDRMVIKQLPSRLPANKYTFLAEHQLSPQMLKKVAPYIQYTKMAGKTPMQMLWASASTTSSEEQSSAEDDVATRRHSVMKADMIVEGGSLRFRLNDITHKQRMPTWTNSFDVMPRDENTMHTRDSSFSSFESSNKKKSSGEQEQDDEQENSELPSRHSYGQRQAIRKFGSSMSSQQNNARCVMDKSFEVESFDGKKYKIPMTTCWTVLAKDCGSPSSPTFTVLAKKQSERHSDLKIKLLVPKKQFVLYEKRGQMQIELNGEALSENKWEENGIHKITETRRPTFVLHCPTTGMELRFDGRTTMIAITDNYINRQCGVCGHYNLDGEDTLRKEDNTLTSSLKEFHASYLYRDAQDAECSKKAQEKFDSMKEEEYHRRSKFTASNSNSNDEDDEEKNSSDELMNEMEKKNKDMHTHAHQASNTNDEDESNKENKPKHRGGTHQKGGKRQNKASDSDEYSSEFEKIEPKLMTKYVEEEDIVCFSIQPQMSCPPGTTPIVEDWYAANDESTNEEGPEKEFKCMSRHQPEARRMLKQARKGRVIEALKTMSGNKNLPVAQAKTCARHTVAQDPDF